MADHPNVKIYSIRAKTGTRGLSRSLITNLYVKFQNSEWRIQHGGSICKILLNWCKNWYSRVLEITEYEASPNILKFKIVDPIWRIKMSAFARFG